MKNLKVKILIITLSLISAVGCGSSKNFSSMDGSTAKDLPSPLVDSTGRLLTECNTFALGSVSVEGQLSTVYDYSYVTGQLVFVDTEIKMQFTRVPSRLSNSSSTYLQFIKWTADTNNQVSTDSNPVEIIIQKKSTGTVINRYHPITFISRDSLQQLISDYSLGITVDKLFTDYNFILTGMDINFAAVRIEFYDDTRGTAALAKSNALLPAFPADPNFYKRAHGSTLSKIHPNYSLAGDGETEEEYFNRFCARF